MVAITGIMILGGGLSVMLGFWMEIGTWLLFFFLVAAAFMMHNFWAIPDPMQKMVEQSQFMKNMSLAGAALVFYWMVQTNGYGPFALGQPM
jgi:putative oxidoreductase